MSKYKKKIKEDLTGRIFERLTVIKISEKKLHGRKAWECLCECGKTTYYTSSHLKTVKSCGCARIENGRKSKHNLMNQKFGCLTVINTAENSNDSSAWLCKCDCGNEKIILSSGLKSGHSVTCGCKINLFPNKDPKLSSANKVFYSKYADGDLTFDQFLELSQKNCSYCGIEPINFTNRLSTPARNERRKRNNQFEGEIGTFIYNGLDRIDSSRGHYIDNVVPCCRHCNRAKLAMNVNDFKSMIVKIYEFWIIKKDSRSFNPESILNLLKKDEIR